LTHTKPFHRNFRGIVPGPNSGYSQWAYIIDRDYAIAPEHYVRAFLLIQNDLVRLFEFIEPADQNLSTYSYRTHELLLRSCIEAEANFKAILKENRYNPVDKNGVTIPEKRWNIHNYQLVNKTHHLSSYRVHVPIWAGAQSMFAPFAEWNTGQELTWYQAYNKSKHDRQDQFKLANLESLLNAITGLLVLLSSQFCTQEFSPASSSLAISGHDYYDGQAALGGFFRIEFPKDWSKDELYEFDWQSLKNEPDRFNKIDYNLIT
jgi:hypothetical protein